MYFVKIKNGFVSMGCCLTCEYYPGSRCVKTYCGDLGVYTADPTSPGKKCSQGRDSRPSTAPCSAYKKWCGC